MASKKGKNGKKGSNGDSKRKQGVLVKANGESTVSSPAGSTSRLQTTVASSDHAVSTKSTCSSGSGGEKEATTMERLQKCLRPDNKKRKDRIEEFANARRRTTRFGQTKRRCNYWLRTCVECYMQELGISHGEAVAKITRMI